MTPAPPFALIAEVTHRCPLACGYCSNPLHLTPSGEELPTETWADLFAQAADMGALHLHLTGGEPLARRDLPALVAAGARAGLYTNLITAGLTLSEAVLNGLIEAGLDHIQLSFQGSEAKASDAVAVYEGAHARKLAAAERIRRAGLPLTANFVVHRRNLGDLEAMLALGESLGASRIEIAHVQYHGWALANRAALLPSLDQLLAATATVEAARARLKGRVVIDYVIPDYYAKRPKACMGGWGRQVMLITPEGVALPCHAAASLPGLSFPDARATPLASIWREDPAFAAYRPPAFIPEGCRGCAHFETDFGGCRCQAHALAGEADLTDPACPLSAHHDRVLAARDAAAETDLIARGR
jgi:PqqA peptide cyclase